MLRVSSSRVVVRSALFAVLVITAQSSVVSAQDQAPPCPEHVIEGTIDTVAADGGARMASAYLHTSGVPVPDHQVIATFSDASGTAIGEPSILVTDAGGRAQVSVPESAESVNFVAESLNVPGCSGDTNPDPRVLLEIVPVGMPGGASPGDSGPEEVLAKTGPVSDVIVVSSLLLLAFGAAVGTGKGRRRLLGAAGGGVKHGFRR